MLNTYLPSLLPQTKVFDESKVRDDLKKPKYVISPTICTEYCRFDLVRTVAELFGFREVNERQKWLLFWTDNSVNTERALAMKAYQKINHFPGMLTLTRKSGLAKNLRRMAELYPTDYNFFPETWTIPSDKKRFCRYLSGLKDVEYFIVKPDNGCQGKGIFITFHADKVMDMELTKYGKIICQKYIARPFLIDGYKFDIRLYVLITSVSPLRLYVHRDGIVRFATVLYEDPSPENIRNHFMHLTNYYINKRHTSFNRDMITGSKRSLLKFREWFDSNGYDSRKIWNSMDNVIVKTILSGLDTLVHNYKSCFASRRMTNACFEILGFDLMLTEKLDVLLVEVNQSPSYNTESDVDNIVKKKVLEDTFRMTTMNLAHNESQNRSASQTEIEERWEDEHCGGYRKIYPTFNKSQYEQWIKLER